MGKRPAVDMTETIGGRSLAEWESEWETLAGGFAQEHPSLHGVVGLYRADLNGRAKVIGSGTDIEGAALAKRLQTLRSETIQTGNDYSAATYIRDNMDRLTLKVIRVGTGAGLDKITSKLAGRMRRLHGLRRGVIPPD